MNTRHAIQPTEQPAVLSVAYSASRNRFITGLAEGCRVFRVDNCLTTYQPRIAASETSLTDGGVGVAAMLDDRYLAYVKGGRTPRGSTHNFVFWDAVLGMKVKEFNLHEPIIAINLSTTFAAITLVERTILFQYQNIKIDEASSSSSTSSTNGEYANAPNRPHSLHKTTVNSFGLCILRANLLVLPAQSTGQVQLVPLPSGSKRVFRAHTTQLRAMALSDDSSLLATASVQGTLIRVFDTRTLDQIGEFRRGVDHAVIYSLAISPGNRWLACTSDKGTLHVFDLRPDVRPAAGEAHPSLPQRISGTNHLRNLSTATPPSIDSAARSSPPASVQYQGSVQEYYGLLPSPPTTSPTSQTAAMTALNAFKHSAFAPRALRDVRSVASVNFHLGEEPPHWQGGVAQVFTTGPDGTRRRVNRPIPPLAAEPSGRPPKGVLAFATSSANDDDGAQLYSVGGGRDAQWERFRLARATGNDWNLINEGFRRYLTKQFPED